MCSLFCIKPVVDVISPAGHYYDAFLISVFLSWEYHSCINLYVSKTAKMALLCHAINASEISTYMYYFPVWIHLQSTEIQGYKFKARCMAHPFAANHSLLSHGSTLVRNYLLWQGQFSPNKILRGLTFLSFGFDLQGLEMDHSVYFFSQQKHRFKHLNESSTLKKGGAEMTWHVVAN